MTLPPLNNFHAHLPVYLYEMPTPYELYLQYGSSYDVYGPLLYKRYLRTVLSERQNYRCCYCGDHMEYEGEISSMKMATFEHVHRKEDGGSDDEDNLVMACHDCNSFRGRVCAYQYTGPGVYRDILRRPHVQTIRYFAKNEQPTTDRSCSLD